MTPEAALTELLARMGARNDARVLVREEELGRWPAAAVAAMKSQGLLAKASPATSVICPGCERECTMPVHTIPTGPLAPISFLVCDKRSQMLCLRTEGELILAAGNNQIPLLALVGFQDGKYSVDVVMIRRLVDSATTADSRYTPSN